MTGSQSDDRRGRRELRVDVAVVGASLAGCTAATLLGRQGADVALIERSPDPAAHKRLCGHFLQASATPVLERLGVVPAMEAAGAVRNSADLHTRWGWIAPRPQPGAPRAHGYSLRRSKLDPIVRDAARAAPGVRYAGGRTAVELLGDGDRCTGVVVRDRTGQETAIRASLVVGADGRASRTAELARAPARRRPNARCCWMAYFAGVERLPEERAALWMLEPDVFIAAPNDDGLTLLAAFLHKDRLADVKADLDGAFARLMRTVPPGPSFADAVRVSPFVGYVDYPAVARPPAPGPGLALVGDAALTCDPTMAIGCGWALQSGAWLADAVAPALRGDGSLDRALSRYARRHHHELAGHARLLDQAAQARPANPVERLMLRAAARDPEMARHFERFATRSMRPSRFLAPRALGRAVRANLAPAPG
ncbi:MAG TPA: NAD(P)/FAD-dependent oxidoreductase [Baekduia sp.]|nr:NAD(P)/FAD-dependent oxidoreductase [Baekduia sp.]